MDYLTLMSEKYFHFRKSQSVWQEHFFLPHRSNLLRILAENKCCTPYIAYPKYQKSSTGNSRNVLFGIAEMFYSV